MPSCEESFEEAKLVPDSIPACAVRALASAALS